MKLKKQKNEEHKEEKPASSAKPASNSKHAKPSRELALKKARDTSEKKSPFQVNKSTRKKKDEKKQIGSPEKSPNYHYSTSAFSSRRGTLPSQQVLREQQMLKKEERERSGSK